MKVRDRFEEIYRLEVRVLAIAFAPLQMVEGFRTSLGLPFPVAADPERISYRRYGLLRGSWWTVWHPRVLWKYAVLISRGMRLRWSFPREDLAQLGGDFVIDHGGTIRFAHPSHGPSDRPDTSELIRSLSGRQ